MTPDDVNYALLLLLSLPLAYFIRYFKSIQSKRLFISSVGVTFVAITCGYNSFHSLVTVLVNYVIITRIRPRYIHILSYIWCFGYLTFFRLCHLFGFQKTGSFVNAIQLLLTLKMVGLAFEIHDSRHASTDPNMSMTGTETSRLSRTEESLSEDETYNPPSFLEFCSYSYCFVGLLTGPYFKFETFEDMINSDYNSYIPVWSFIWRRNAVLPVIVIVFLILSHYFKLEHVTSDWFLTDTTFIERILYMMAMFVIFRTRLYLAWFISETVCMLSCLGAYPVPSLPQCGHGPTSKSAYEEWRLLDEETKRTTEFNFETIKCIDLWGCELSPTVREGMKSWNMTVQYWLANFVYKRTRFFKNYCSRITITMMVSAYWHGIHPGYYLSFIIIPFSLVAESQLNRAFNRTKWSGINCYTNIYRTFLWIIKMRLFEYMCMGFLLLSLEKTITFWGCIYFCGHILVAFLIVFGWLANRYISNYKPQYKSSN